MATSNNAGSEINSNHIESFFDDNRNDIDNATPDHKIFYYKKRYEELQEEFEEFQFSSRELENELETQLSHYERRIKELELKNSHLTNENDLLRQKYEKQTNESNQQIIMLQKKLSEYQTVNEQLTTHIRELEQSNDDLERAKRHLDATLADFDLKLNEQIERNELLESEIGEKEQLQVVIQRLKDEARDLRLELMIQQNVKNTNKSNKISTPTTTTAEESQQSLLNNRRATISSPLSANSNSDDNRNCNISTTASLNNTNNNNNITVINNHHYNHLNHQNNTNLKTSPTTVTSNQIPLLSASSRISALNIVSDLLRKVGALESKLASCRNIMPLNSNMNVSSTNNGQLLTATATSPSTALKTATNGTTTSINK